MENAPQIYARMASVLGDIGAVGKDRRNEAQRYKFRGIDDVYNAVNSACKKHQIFCTPKVLRAIYREPIKSKSGQDGWHQILEIEYTFWAPDGSSVSAIVWGEAAEFGGDKVTNKCLSIGHKYALFQIFMIATEESDDPDAKSPYKEAEQAPPTKKGEPHVYNVVLEQKPAAPAPTDDMTIDDLRADMIDFVRGAPLEFFSKTGKGAAYYIDKIMKEIDMQRLRHMHQTLQRLANA